MQHLETERIAAFDHEAPSVEELAHLAACTVCRTERNAFSALNQRSMHMADAPAFPPAPRLTNWESLSQRLRAEGLIAGDAPAVHVSDVADASNELRFENVMRALNNQSPAPGRAAKLSQPIAIESWWKRALPRTGGEILRAAAAIVFFGVSGAGINQIINEGFGGAANTSSTEPTTAGIGTLDFGNTGYSSIDDATKALARIEREFDRTTTWITANDPSANKSDMLRQRLAALDRVVATTRAEWQASPQDRVLDHYYRAAQAQRELTLKQLSDALPAGRSLGIF